MNRKAVELLVPALLVLVCIALFLGYFIHPGLEDQGRTSLGTGFDFHSYFMPRFVLGSKEVFSGHLPLWNRYEYGGIPLLATGQPAALYPPKVLLFGIFTPRAALWIYLSVHYVALAGTFLLFMRQQGIVGVAAFAGVVVWVFSPPLLLSSYNPVRIANMVWMPLVFLLSERVAREKGLAVFGGLALVVAMQLVAGYPEATIDTGFLVAIHATASYYLKRWEDPPWVTLPRIGAAFVLGALAAGVQLLPLAELATIAQRRQVTQAVGQPVRDLFSTLMGTIPVFSVFVVVGLFVKRARPAAFGLLTCFMMSEGGWRLLRLLPGFSMTRFPYVWVFLWVLFFAWLAAEGVQALVAGALPPRLASRPLPRRLRRARSARVVPHVFDPPGDDGGVDAELLAWKDEPRLGPRGRRVALYAAGIFGSVLVVACAVEAHGIWAGVPHSALVARYLGSPLAAALGILGGALLVAVAVVTLRGRAAPWGWLAALSALTLGHLAGYPYGNLPSPFTRPTKHGNIATLYGERSQISGRTLSLEDILYGFEISDQLPSPLGVEFSFLPFRYRQLLFRFKFLPFYGTIDWELFTRARGFLNAMDVQYIATHVLATRSFAEQGLRPIRRSRDMVLFYNPAHLGHAWVTYATHPTRSEDEALEALLDPKFDPGHEVILEEDTARPLPHTTVLPPTSPVAERRSSATDVEFDVELDRPGVLVVSESAYPGWTATVNGHPARILVGNYVLRAVELDAGKSTVRFEYRPASVRYGLIASGAGLLGVVGLFVVGRKRRTRLAAPAIS